MPFADILGHERVLEVFKRSIRGGKTSHSYIFEGLSGCGRRKTAMALIQALFCQSGEDDACGTCSSCRKITSGNHADIHFIQPLPDKRDISIDQLREMQRELALRPYEAPRKACLIEPAERMSVNAANSLLKTLEEPPGNAVIILLSENAGMLLPTIRSRCQLVRFAPLSPEHVRQVLERTGIESEAAAILAPMAGGSVQRALELDDESLTEKQELLLKHLSQLNISRIASIFNAAEELSGNRNETLEILDMLISISRDIVHLAAGSSEIINAAIRPALESMSRGLNLDRALQMTADVIEIRQAVQRNANVKLALDHLFIKMASAC